MNDRVARPAAIVAAFLALILAQIALLYVALDQGPRLLLDADIGSSEDLALRANAIDDLRRTLVASIATLSISTTLIVAVVQIRFRRRKQMSERYMQSLRDLGADSPTVRTGAIHTFSLLARESAEDRGEVAKLLSAFLRGTRETGIGSKPERRLQSHWLEVRRPDVFAAWQLLGSLSLKRHTLPREFNLLLTNTDGAYGLLHGLRFRGVSFAEADLRGAVFRGGRFRDCDFTDAVLDGSDFSDSHFRDCVFAGCAAQDIRFDNAKLRNVRFTGSDLSNASFDRAALRNVAAVTCELNGVVLTTRTGEIAGQRNP